MERKRNPETSKCVKKFKCKVIKMSSKQSAPSNLFLCPLGLATTTAAILLYKSQILRFLNPRLLFMYLYYIKSYKDLKQIVNSETDYQDMNSWKKVARLTIKLVCTGTLLNGWQSSNTLRRTFFPAALSALYI